MAPLGWIRIATRLTTALSIAACNPVSGFGMNYVEECRRLAGSVDEPNNPKKVGVPLDKMNTLQAIRVCREARSIAPYDPITAYRLARAYVAPGPMQDISAALHLQRFVWGGSKRAASRIGAEAAAWYAAYGKSRLTFSTYTKAAEQGNVIAQMSLAHMHTYKYFNSEMREPDFKLAIQWMRRAAEQGYAPAQNQLGGFLAHEGKYDEAIIWYTRASEQNYPNAFLSLGLAFDKGRGVPKDDRIALELLSKAANAGITYAQLVLARKIRNGEGIEPSPELAFKWYKIAADAGDPDARIIVKKLEAEKQKDDMAVIALLTAVGLLMLLPSGDGNPQTTNDNYNENWIEDWEATNKQALQNACAWMTDDEKMAAGCGW